ncbi:MAG: mechanosensitive ion channel family protein [Thermoplasmatota archaeon]
MKESVKKAVILFLLLIISIILLFLDYFIGYPFSWKLFISAASITVLYLVFKLFFEELLVGRLKDYKARYTVKKTTSILFLLICSVILVGIWIENTQAILVAYGLIAAGIAISLQDFFKGFTGGLLILVNNLYRVGDRIEINGTFGDVMDIGILYTTLLETRGWVKGDQASGRIISLPNSLVLSNPVFNYTKDHSFLWEEINIPLSFDSNWESIVGPILEIVRDHTKEITEQASDEVKKIGEKYYLPKRDVEPSVFVSFDKEWINVNVRYTTEARKRRYHSDILFRSILKEVSKHKDVKIAQAQLESWKLGEGPN